MNLKEIPATPKGKVQSLAIGYRGDIIPTGFEIALGGKCHSPAHDLKSAVKKYFYFPLKHVTPFTYFTIHFSITGQWLAMNGDVISCVTSLSVLKTPRVMHN